MVSVPILALRWRPHQAPLKGSVTGSLYHFKKGGFGLAICLIDERDVGNILKNKDYRLASEKEYLMYRR